RSGGSGGRILGDDDQREEQSHCRNSNGEFLQSGEHGGNIGCRMGLDGREERRPGLAAHGQEASSSKQIASTGIPNGRAIRKATASEGSCLPVSIALTAWRDTSIRLARSA